MGLRTTSSVKLTRSGSSSYVPDDSSSLLIQGMSRVTMLQVDNGSSSISQPNYIKQAAATAAAS